MHGTVMHTPTSVITNVGVEAAASYTVSCPITAYGNRLMPKPTAHSTNADTVSAKGCQ